MKKLILITVALASGCTSALKEQMTKNDQTIVTAVNEAYAIANAAAIRVFEKEIAKCKAEGKILDLGEFARTGKVACSEEK